MAIKYLERPSTPSVGQPSRVRSASRDAAPAAFRARPATRALASNPRAFRIPVRRPLLFDDVTIDGVPGLVTGSPGTVEPQSGLKLSPHLTGGRTRSVGAVSCLVSAYHNRWDVEAHPTRAQHPLKHGLLARCGAHGGRGACARGGP